MTNDFPDDYTPDGRKVFYGLGYHHDGRYRYTGMCKLHDTDVGAAELCDSFKIMKGTRVELDKKENPGDYLRQPDGSDEHRRRDEEPDRELPRRNDDKSAVGADTADEDAEKELEEFHRIMGPGLYDNEDGVLPM